MRVPVFWKTSLGVILIEPSYISPTVVEEKLYVTIEYEFDQGIGIDSRELLHEMSRPSKCVERRAVYDALRNLDYTPNSINSRRGFHYTLSVSRKQLEENGGIVYINDLDIVVGFDNLRDSAIHPYSAEGQVKRLSEAITDYAGYQQRYLIVDSTGKVGPRWVNTGNGIGELNPIKDPSLRDGVYVTTDRGPNYTPETKHYPFPEADEALGLFRHYDQAKTFGSPKARFEAEQAGREEEILRLKKDLQEFKARHDVDKAKYDMERAEWERKRQIEEDRYKQLESDRKRLDDELKYERERHQDRLRFRHDVESREHKHRLDSTKALTDIAKVIVVFALYIATTFAKEKIFNK